MVLSRTARRHCKADRQASLSTVVSAISPALNSLAHLPCHESLPISTSGQVIPLEPPLAGLARLQSIENNLDTDYRQPNSDDYEFRYPQDFDPPSDYMDLDDTLSNNGSWGIDNHAGQIESRPKTPDNTQLHERYSWGPQIQSPGNPPPPSPSLGGSSDSRCCSNIVISMDSVPPGRYNLCGELSGVWTYPSGALGVCLRHVGGCSACVLGSKLGARAWVIYLLLSCQVPTHSRYGFPILLLVSEELCVSHRVLSGERLVFVAGWSSWCVHCYFWQRSLIYWATQLHFFHFSSYRYVRFVSFGNNSNAKKLGLNCARKIRNGTTPRLTSIK
jgi:hypothetical protein